MLPQITAADVAAVDTSLEVTTSAVDTSRRDPARARASWRGVDKLYMSRLDLAAAPLRADTTAISGTAVGGITALVRAGCGRTITATMCGRAIKVLRHHTTSMAA